MPQCSENIVIMRREFIGIFYIELGGLDCCAIRGVESTTLTCGYYPKSKKKPAPERKVECTYPPEALSKHSSIFLNR